MTGKTTSEEIVDVADKLFYEKGYEHTSFADIAAEVGISRGNFYHHFKTKDAILDAVISQRLTNTRAMLEQWETDGQTPEERIRCFIRILITNQTKIMDYGCPVGTLVSELAKLNHAAQNDANRLFTLLSSPDFYRTRTDEIATTKDRLATIEEEILAAYERWETLEKIRETAG